MGPVSFLRWRVLTVLLLGQVCCAAQAQMTATAVLPAERRVASTDAGPSGGKHELGGWGAFSLHSGHYLGFDKHVDYVSLNLQYSYRFWTHENFALRYAPEVTPVSIINEPDFYSSSNPKRTTYGGGLTPVGFQLDFRPKKRVEPFLSEHCGMFYYKDRVLAAEGSQLLFMTDLGLGLKVFPHRRNAVVFAYRYQHFSNANISNKNPGTDTNTFSLGFSRFWDKR